MTYSRALALAGLVLSISPTAGHPQTTCPTKADSTVSVDSLARCWHAADTVALQSVRSRSRDIGNSFVLLSLIKSVAGQIPTSEFFDLRFKFSTGHGDRFFTTANIDIALSQSAADTATNRRLTDAGLALNLAPFKATSSGTSFPARDTTNDRKSDLTISDRITTVVAGTKIFNTVSYLVAGIGGYELKGSPLEGSYVTMSYARRLLANPRIPAGTDTTDITRARASDNIYVEFYVRVPNVQFLDRLRIRGGVLLPLREGFGVETRVVLSVPVVDLTRF